MNVGKAMADQVRTWFNIRKPRSLPRRGAKPRLGTAIGYGGVRIVVQAGLTDRLWNWLQDEGWRELNFRPERRRYRDVPPSWVTRLFDASPDHWPDVLRQAVERANYRPTLNGMQVPGGMPRR